MTAQRLHKVIQVAMAANLSKKPARRSNNPRERLKKKAILYCRKWIDISLSGRIKNDIIGHILM